MKIQLEPGPSSSATHSLTRPSRTLDRRYVSRPTTLAIEEAARSIQKIPQPSRVTTATPSRLVNLRVHDSDLVAARAAKLEAESPSCPAIPSRLPQLIQPPALPSSTNDTEDTENIPANNDYQASSEEATLNYEASYAETYDQATSSTETYPTEQLHDFSYTDDTTYSQAPEVTPTDDYHPMLPATSDINDYDEYTEDYALTEPQPVATMSVSDNKITPPSSNPTPEIDTQALAMSIAADYTTATLGATMVNLPEQISQNPDKLSATINEQRATESIDEIARTASEAIASIRSATDPADIAAQIDSLQNFATNIKTNNDLPEIVELGETIDKFIAIARKSTGIKEETKKKITLSSKATRAANKVTKSSAKIASTNKTKIGSTIKTTPKHPISNNIRPTLSRQAASRTSIKSTSPSTRRTIRQKTTNSKYDNEDLVLHRALQSVAKMDSTSSKQPSRRPIAHKKGNGKRFALAFACAVLCVAAIIYFVGTNIPDISVRVAAMQTGVEASYPSYIPRGYSLDGIKSEDGKISIAFTNSDEDTFTLIEEKSSWDSTTLLRNYVEPTWQNSYSTTHEQGITIYIYGSNAAWVNGGVLYKINSPNNSLTKKQLRNIVTSMQ